MIAGGKARLCLGGVLFKLLGVDPVDVELDTVGNTAVGKRFRNGEIGIVQLDVFADKAHTHALGALLDAFVDGGPLGEVGGLVFHVQLFDQCSADHCNDETEHHIGRRDPDAEDTDQED